MHVIVVASSTGGAGKGTLSTRLIADCALPAKYTSLEPGRQSDA
jgi:cellulose biosynthesis protein BcsQ